MGAVELVQTYDMPPFVCSRCGTPRTPAVKHPMPREMLVTRRDGEPRLEDGWLYLCIACAGEVAGAIGWISPAQVGLVNAEVDALRARVGELEGDLRDALAQCEAALLLLRSVKPELEDEPDGDAPSQAARDVWERVSLHGQAEVDAL